MIFSIHYPVKPELLIIITKARKLKETKNIILFIALIFRAFIINIIVSV